VKRPFGALEGWQAGRKGAGGAQGVKTEAVCVGRKGGKRGFCRQERWKLCVETATAKAVQISVLVRGRQAELTKELAALMVCVCVKGG
jgi:hypothetical protein